MFYGKLWDKRSLHLAIGSLSLSLAPPQWLLAECQESLRRPYPLRQWEPAMNTRERAWSSKGIEKHLPFLEYFLSPWYILTIPTVYVPLHLVLDGECLAVFSCDAIVLSEFLMWTAVLMRKYGLVTFRPLASWVMLITCKSCVSRMLNRPCFHQDPSNGFPRVTSSGAIMNEIKQTKWCRNFLHVRGTTECGRRLTAAANALAVSTLLALAQSWWLQSLCKAFQIFLHFA